MMRIQRMMRVPRMTTRTTRSRPSPCPSTRGIVDALQIIHRLFLASAVIGAVAGCICSSPPWGLLVGGITGFLCFAVSTLVFTRGRGIWAILPFSIFALLPAAVGGTTGAAVHGGLGGGVWALACGIATGGVGAMLLSPRRTLGLDHGSDGRAQPGRVSRPFVAAGPTLLRFRVGSDPVGAGGSYLSSGDDWFCEPGNLPNLRGGQSSEPLQTWRSLDSLRRAAS